MRANSLFSHKLCTRAAFSRALTTEGAVGPFNQHWSDSWGRVCSVSSSYLWLVLWTVKFWPIAILLQGVCLLEEFVRFLCPLCSFLLFALLFCASHTFRLARHVEENSGYLVSSSGYMSWLLQNLNVVKSCTHLLALWAGFVSFGGKCEISYGFLD